MAVDPPPQLTDIDQMGAQVQAWLVRSCKLFPISLALLALGFLGIVLGQHGFFVVVFLIGLLLLAIQFLIYYPRLLTQDQVIEQWSVLIDGANGRREEIIGQTERCLTSTAAPGLSMRREDVLPGIIRGALGGTRLFLIVANGTNINLAPFQLYVNAMDYGVCLHVSWYLVQRPSVWHKFIAICFALPILGLMFFPFIVVSRLGSAHQSGLMGLDIFDQQDLQAFVTTAHHSVLEAVDALMLDLNQDSSKINRPPRGFLGIS